VFACFLVFKFLLWSIIEMKFLSCSPSPCLYPWLCLSLTRLVGTVVSPLLEQAVFLIEVARVRGIVSKRNYAIIYA
jgi:hypothetical protein